MRWVRFKDGGAARIGRVENATQVQPVAATKLQEVMRDEGLEPVGDPVPVDQVRILEPVRPSKVIAVGQNYLDHIREQGIDLPDHPVIFAKFPTSIIGPGEEIRWPRKLTKQVDYEAELAVIIGRRAKALTEEEALEAVFGYTAANDVSARDLQFSDGQWVRGKALDTSCPLGPVAVGKDEVHDPQALQIACRLNNKTMQESDTGQMIFSVAQLLVFISEVMTLEPGDVILTGTPPGVGHFRDPQVFLEPGDTVEVEIGQIGILSNPVGDYL